MTVVTTRTAPVGLDAIFRPRSVAVIGASRRPGSIGAAIFKNLLAHGFDGPVYPVNPTASVVQSVLAWPSVSAIPGDVDLAVIVVPSAQVLAALEECGKKGVKGAVVISAGFKETGPEGAERERALRDCARRYGMRLVGPNCLGVLNTVDGMGLDATFAPAWPPSGPVAFSSQSGALGIALLADARRRGLGISSFVSVGNKADVSGNDLLAYWAQDERTQVIALYLESFGNPRTFARLAPEVSRQRPNVRATAARDAHRQSCGVAGECLPLVDRDERGSELQLLAATRRRVGARSANLFCRVRRRNLHDLAGQSRDAVVDRTRDGQRRFARDLAGRVVGVRLRAEGDRRVVHFRLAVDERHQARSASEEQNQQPGRKRIECTGVPDPSGVHTPPDDRHDVVRRHAGGFVDEQETRDVSRQRLHWRLAAGPL